MATMTLTEFNQNPSRVVRMMESEAQTVICVTKRGVPLFQVSGLKRDDPVTSLVSAGLATRPLNPSGEPVAYVDDLVPVGVDLMADLLADRGRRG